MFKDNYKIIGSLLRQPILAIYVLSSIYFDQAYASPYSNTGAGGLADSIMEPVGLVSNFVQAGCVILGSSFLLASIVKYFEHRRSPLMVPISTVIFLLVGGTLLLAIPIFNYFYTRAYGINL